MCLDAFYWMIIPHVIIKYENAYQQNKTNASSPNRIYQHINHHCSFSCCFIKNIIDTSTKSASFLAFSQGLLGVFPWFSHVFHPILAWCFLPSLHFSHGFPMIFPILPSSHPPHPPVFSGRPPSSAGAATSRGRWCKICWPPAPR